MMTQTEPKHWQDDPGDLLALAVYRYQNAMPMYGSDVAFIRHYLRQWIDAPSWDRKIEPADRTRFDELRRAVRDIKEREDISVWLRMAKEFEMDPLS